MFGIGFLASAASLPGGRAGGMAVNVYKSRHLVSVTPSAAQPYRYPNTISADQPAHRTNRTNQPHNRSNRDVESCGRAGAGGQPVLCSVIVWRRGMWRAPLAAQPSSKSITVEIQLFKYNRGLNTTAISILIHRSLNVI